MRGSGGNGVTLLAVAQRPDGCADFREISVYGVDCDLVGFHLNRCSKNGDLYSGPVLAVPDGFLADRFSGCNLSGQAGGFLPQLVGHDELVDLPAFRFLTLISKHSGECRIDAEHPVLVIKKSYRFW